jgi:hypothetical protein
MSLKGITKIFLFIIIVELCLGGGGRLTATGPVSLRMVLFAVALVLTILRLLQGERLPKFYYFLIGIFCFIILFGIVVGIINQNNPKLIWEDVKPLLYFLILPFFSLAINKNEIVSIERIIRLCSIILVICFFVLLILIHSRVLPFLSFYETTLKTEEFFYRGELSFFYKGFLFLGIGAILYFFSDKKNRGLLIALFALSIIISVTRGLLVSASITLSIYFLNSRKKYLASFTLSFAVMVGILGNDFTFYVSQLIDSHAKGYSLSNSSPNLFGDRGYSDTGRLEQIKEVAERISFSAALIGHGFGAGIPSRPVHMEISYLEIFHKQGLVGLSFWLILGVVIFHKYGKLRQTTRGDAFFYTAVFVCLQSFTNQYLNNPIGMSMVLLSLVCLDKLNGNFNE